MANKFHEWWDVHGFTAKDTDKYEAIKKSWYSAKKEVFDAIEDITVYTTDGYLTTEYERLKRKHLTNNSNKTPKGDDE